LELLKGPPKNKICKNENKKSSFLVDVPLGKKTLNQSQENNGAR
jgi:hypothetical protein